MIIHGLTVCVNYADFFAKGIARWRSGLSSLTVVTTREDVETDALATRYGCNVSRTDAFTSDGAIFNKGRAMEFARAGAMDWSDWCLFFDSDVIPPEDWKHRVEVVRPQSGSLYGTYRFAAAGDDLEDHGQPRFPHDVPGVGYLQLFHTSDPAVVTAPGEPLLDTHWIHAGNYDNAFMNRWRTRGIPVRQLPFRVAHLGERDNWFGRGERAAFDAMQAERRRRGGTWDHERVAGEIQ